MNWHHFRAILWLRWWIWFNQLKRGGKVQLVIMAFFLVIALLAGIGFFFAGFVIGELGLAQAPPIIQMAVWDGLVVIFLFSWTAGVVAELQRSESLSLEKLLHLPVSLTGAFLINYLATLVRRVSAWDWFLPKARRCFCSYRSWRLSCLWSPRSPTSFKAGWRR